MVLQQRGITQYEDHGQGSWKLLCANHRFRSSADYETVLFTADTTLGYDGGLLWGQKQVTLVHRARVSHVFLYRAYNEGQPLLADAMGFVENPMSQRWPSDAVVTDCIGLVLGVPFHVNDITVRDKRLKLNSFRVLFTDPAQAVSLCEGLRSSLDNLLFQTHTTIGYSCTPACDTVRDWH